MIIYQMRKGLKIVTFQLFADGSFCQIDRKGQSGRVPDFAQFFIWAREHGYKPINEKKQF